MNSALAGRLPVNPNVVRTVDRGGSAVTELDHQLQRMKHMDARSFSYIFLYHVVFDENNRLQMVGEKPTRAALKIGECLTKYGMTTVQKLELRGDETGGKKMVLGGILEFLASSPSLREFSYASRDKTLPPLYLKALQQNDHYLLRLELTCSHFPMKELCSLVKDTKTLAYLRLDGHVHMNQIYHVNHQKLKRLCLALAANQSLKELDFFVLNFNNKNSKKKLITVETNNTVKVVRFRNGNTDANSAYNLLHVLGAVEDIDWALMGRNDTVLFETLGSATNTKRSLSLDFVSHTNQPPDPILIRDLIERQEGLKHLSLSYGASPGLQSFLRTNGECFASHPSLRSLQLANVSDDGLEFLSNAPLIKLDIWTWAKESGIPNLCALLKRRHCTIEELSLHIDTLECFGDLCLALKENNSLQSLALVSSRRLPNHQQIDEAGIDRLYNCLGSFTMKRISFSGSSIGHSFCRHLFQALSRETNPYITELEIDSNEPELIDMESMAFLCCFLKLPDCHLSTLLLKSEAQNIEPESVEFLLATLASYITPVETLHVTCNWSNLKAISNYIPKIQTLKKLTLHVFNDFDDAWRGERLKIDLLIAISCSDSLQEFNCNLDEDGHFFQNRLYFFNQQKKIDRLLALPDDEQLPLGAWPYVMESMQKKTHCPSLLFYTLNVHASSIFNRGPLDDTLSVERTKSQILSILGNDRKPVTSEAPPEQAPSEKAGYLPESDEFAMNAAYVGCGCLPAFLDWDWKW